MLSTDVYVYDFIIDNKLFTTCFLSLHSQVILQCVNTNVCIEITHYLIPAQPLFDLLIEFFVAGIDFYFSLFSHVRDFMSLQWCNYHVS